MYDEPMLQIRTENHKNTGSNILLVGLRSIFSQGEL